MFHDVLFYIVLKKHWVGPTVNIWNAKKCPPLKTLRKSTFACKRSCELNEDCNAIIVTENEWIWDKRGMDWFGGIDCQLIQCSFPVPAPDLTAQNPAWVYKTQGYFQATGKNRLDIKI